VRFKIGREFTDLPNSWMVGKSAETGFETIGVQLNDHTNPGVGGREYGKSKDVETPKG
jgi:hypothetical protein